MNKSKVQIQKLGNQQLLTYAQNLAGHERSVKVQFLKTIGEIERRRLYREAGYANLFRYLVDELKFSESSAGQRKNACRAAHKYPELYGLLESGAVSLTNVSKISRLLIEKNRKDLIEKIIGKTTREVDLLLATDQVKNTNAKDRICVLGVVDSGENNPSSKPGSEQSSNEKPLSDNREKCETTPEQGEPLELNVETNLPEDKDILVKIHFLTNQQVNKKLERAKELLARKHPQGQLNEIIEELVDFYLEKKDPLEKPVKKAKPENQTESLKEAKEQLKDQAVAESPKKSSPALGTREPRRPSLNVQRMAMQRSGGRCEWLDRQGRRCKERRYLEYDHKIPYSLGGRSIEENIRVLCASHNKVAAKELFSRSKN